MTSNSELLIGSYNCDGFTSSSKYLNRFLSDKHIDILCLQDTWLLDRNIDKLNDMHPAYQTCGKSGIDAAERILPGRPPGGVAIAWRQSLSHNTASFTSIIDVAVPSDLSLMLPSTC